MGFEQSNDELQTAIDEAMRIARVIGYQLIPNVEGFGEILHDKFGMRCMSVDEDTRVVRAAFERFAFTPAIAVGLGIEDHNGVELQRDHYVWSTDVPIFLYAMTQVTKILSSTEEGE